MGGEGHSQVSHWSVKNICTFGCGWNVLPAGIVGVVIQLQSSTVEDNVALCSSMLPLHIFSTGLGRLDLLSYLSLLR